MAISMLAAVGCKGKKADQPKSEIQQKVDEYAEFELKSDLIQNLSANEKELVKIFIEIGKVMDDILHPRLRRAPRRLQLLPERHDQGRV